MNRFELKIKLDLLGIPENQYSLNGDLKPDCIILFHNYSQWEVFYLSERGDRDNLQIFDSEEKACNHIYQLFIESKKIEQQFGIKT